MKLEIFTLPPTGAGASVRVFSNVAGWTVSALSTVSCSVGWNFHALLRKSRMTGVSKVTAAPTRTGSVSDRYGSGTSFAVDRKFSEAPSSRTIARAALSFTTSRYSSVSGRATSVGVRSGPAPAASPTSAYWLVEYVLVTVKSPCGARSMPSKRSRSSSVAGHSIFAGSTAAGVSSSNRTPSAATVSCVCPKYSLAGPVTSTKSPFFTWAVAAEPKTKIASDAVCAATSMSPPVPGVWRKKPLYPPVG